MRTIILMALLCISLSSCETLKEVQNSPGINALGSFKLGSVQENNYWYDGRSYEYNEYKIEITSEPVQAKVSWNGIRLHKCECESVKII